MSGCQTTEVVNLRDVPAATDVLDARGLTCGELEPLMAQRLRAVPEHRVRSHHPAVRGLVETAEEGAAGVC